MGPAFALRFQRVRLAHAIHRLGNDVRWHLWLAVTPDRSGPWPKRVNVMDQGGGDLGERLTNVLGKLPAGPCLFVGSDIPGISRQLVAEAFHKLAAHDAVIGPSSDGGYWAIGIRRVPRAVVPFEDVRWSTPNALADTLRNLRGCSVGLLPQLDDIDDVDSLKRMPGWDLLIGPKQ